MTPPVEPRAATLLRHYDKGRLTMELSWLLETDGRQYWTLLDDREGHRGFDNEADARTEFARRQWRRTEARPL